MSAETNFHATGIRIEDGIVCFDGHHETPESERATEGIARELIPWRKGPFRLGQLVLDAEWRSDRKWDRIVPALPDLRGKIVADVGCNNGYYLFRIAEAGARLVVGFDPTEKYKRQYDLLAAHAPAMPIEFRLEGWQALKDFPERFDVIFLMGVNYHDPEPRNIFDACRHALKPGGLLIAESVVVHSDQILRIYPGGKYAGIGGVFAIPTVPALSDELTLAGFRNVKMQHEHRLTNDEQRAAEFSPQTSLKDYPPLYRAAVFAEK